MIIVDAHSHLWLRQDTTVDGYPIRQLQNGRSLFFGEERQMLPPFMIDGRNSAEVFLSNMDYACVSAAVVVQELIDGNQNDYLGQVASAFGDRFFCCGMPDLSLPPEPQADRLADLGFKGVALPAHRMHCALDGRDWMHFFKRMEERQLILDICLPDDAGAIARMENVIRSCPSLKVAVGHFGMATGNCWLNQIRLAEYPCVYIESGGITWLYNSEFYPFPSAIEAICKAADMVGMEKLMWGSDYPRTITAITYRMSYDFVLKSEKLSDTGKRLFLGENAVKFYGLKNLKEMSYIKNMSE